jgi:hypothetical protein
MFFVAVAHAVVLEKKTPGQEALTQNLAFHHGCIR